MGAMIVPGEGITHMAAFLSLMFAATMAAAPESSTAVETPLPAMMAQPAPGPSSQQEYDEKYIWAEDFPVVHGDRHFVGTTIETFFYQGRYRKPLVGADLYDAVGRTDLAATYRKRMTGKYLLYASGVALFVGGVVYAFSSSSPAPDVNLPPDQFAKQAQAVQDASLAVAF